MPKRTDLKSILILGAGPIVIGQACEFDYSGAQACKALREEGFRVILVNSNPATIMTDPAMADSAYIEPITWKTVEKIIEKEVNSAFIGTDLKQQLDKLEIKKVVIVGLTTDHCVSSSTRMAGNLGYDTFLVADATATFDKVGADGTKYKAEMIHEVELASLHNEFALVIKTDDLLKII